MLIRAFQSGDTEAVVELWRRCGLTRPWNDAHRDIERKLADSPWGLIIGEVDGRVSATVMVGYDGHRGSVNYLAVDPAEQGRGFGGQLLDHAELLLLQRDCPKVHVMVRSENAQVARFYETRGYALMPQQDILTLGRRMIQDQPG